MANSLMKLAQHTQQEASLDSLVNWPPVLVWEAPESSPLFLLYMTTIM